MARTNEINSATAQFFVNLVDNDFLDHAGAVELRLRGIRQGHLRHGRHRQDREGRDRHARRPSERAGRGRDHHQGVTQRVKKPLAAAAGPMGAHRAGRRVSRHRAAGVGHALDGPVVQRVHAGRGAGSQPAGKTNYQTDYRWVDLEQISPHAAVAVIAAEDQFFPFHTGFDFKSIREAVRFNEAQAERKRRTCAAPAPSASRSRRTCSCGRDGATCARGSRSYFTLLIELTWPKERILEVYLNVAQFGDGIYGVEAAAQRFYRKPAARLGRYEARRSPPCCRIRSRFKRRTRRPTMSSAAATGSWPDARAGRGARYLDELENPTEPPKATARKGDRK